LLQKVVSYWKSYTV